MIKRSIIISLLLILTFQTGKADNTGKWNSYLSYYQIQNIEKANDILFVQASNALYAYNFNADKCYASSLLGNSPGRRRFKIPHLPDLLFSCCENNAILCSVLNPLNRNYRNSPCNHY